MKQIDQYLFFYGGKDGIYSNWYKCYFDDPLTKIQFPTSEQAFMWYKADFFRDEETKSKLIIPMHPREAKELGRDVQNYNQKAWEAVRYGFMVYVNYLKFSQNEDLKKQMLDTGNLHFVEASPYDTVWGIGLGLDTDENLLSLQFMWKGRNLLGKALDEVKEMIR